MKAFILMIVAMFALTAVAIADEIPAAPAGGNAPAAVEVAPGSPAASNTVVQKSAKKKHGKKKKKKKKKHSSY